MPREAQTCHSMAVKHASVLRSKVFTLSKQCASLLQAVQAKVSTDNVIHGQATIHTQIAKYAASLKELTHSVIPSPSLIVHSETALCEVSDHSDTESHSIRQPSFAVSIPCFKEPIAQGCQDEKVDHPSGLFIVALAFGDDADLIASWLYHRLCSVVLSSSPHIAGSSLNSVPSPSLKWNTFLNLKTICKPLRPQRRNFLKLRTSCKICLNAKKTEDEVFEGIDEFEQEERTEGWSPDSYDKCRRGAKPSFYNAQ